MNNNENEWKLNMVSNPWHTEYVSVCRQEKVERFGKQLVALCALAAANSVTVYEDGESWCADLPADTDTFDVSFVEMDDGVYEGDVVVHFPYDDEEDDEDGA